MQVKRLFVGLIVSVAMAAAAFPVHAAFNPAAGYQATELYTSAGTSQTVSGLDLYNGKLYFSQFMAINSLDLSNDAVAEVGTVDSNTGVSLVAVNPTDGTAYTAYGTSYSPPFPHKMGYVDSAGTYLNQLDMDGIYDAAVNGSGELFIVANPDLYAEEGETGDNPDGSRIYKYDWTNGAVTEIANIGGNSGGLAFDSADNLYYAEQTNGQILKYTPAEVAVGGLGIGDADVVLNVTAGYIDFNADDDLFASTGWGKSLGKYDISTGTKVEDVLSAGGDLEYLGKFTVDGDSIYVTGTDWNAYASTIQAVIPVPEPSSALLLLIGGAALAFVKRRRYS